MNTMPARHDTQIGWLDRRRGLCGGYAIVRNYRSTRGWFTDQRSVLELLPYGSNPIIPVVIDAPINHASREHMVGWAKAWYTDDCGLWCAFQLGKSPQMAKVVQGIDTGALYFCAAQHPDYTTFDGVTGYVARWSAHFLRLTPAPSYRPNTFDHAEDYLASWIDIGYWNDDVWHCAANEETPLHAPLPMGWNDVPEELFR